ncbi:Phage capsid scaffolding protein (GPO) serine peptidase [Novosphingobium sp. CF614]|uniref:GPO family capsid scaffolding protein n=1 Tax=Novosphingobium sp. CF614 TaxID=1884364 RepID=UPI0008E9AC25|nr:GPO family capsid scaffolding protein [Novosphingobium sp. CF614]SFG08302.1 Phage capsid scaffolding protein (GPO) serine peptidase [Novosphingobium sp. CF614]
MKTKPFLLATAGSTVDGRTIDDKLLKEMASSYDPKTYGARLNIEHIRGISGDKPFRAYGDVLELSTGEVDVNFNGKTEKRLGLFGSFDVTDDAKALNDAAQKVYPSIEIEPDFGGKGFAYLMGCALTDSPAAIATDRLKFNRRMPGTIHLSRDEAALIEFAEDKTGDAADGLVQKFGTMLEGLFAKFTPAKPAADPADPKTGQEAAAFDFAQLKPVFEQLTQAVTAEIGALRTELREEVDGLAVQFKRLEEDREETPANTYRARPKSDGNAGNYAGIF